MPKKRYRWTCPQCSQSKLGSTRPRSNATIRYCLTCSEKEGILVERTCPALEKIRHAKRERSKKKQVKKQSKAIEQRTFGGVDVEKEMRLQCRMLCRAGVWPKRMRKGVRLVIHKSKYKKRAHGLCYYSHITLTLGEDVHESEVKELIFHELTHCACQSDEGHGDGFRSKLVEGARALWGIVIEAGPANAYDLDHAIVDKLKELESSDTEG